MTRTELTVMLIAFALFTAFCFLAGGAIDRMFQ